MGRGTVQRGGRARLVADDRLAHRWPPARVSAAAGGRDRQRDGRFLLQGSPQRDPPARRRGWVGAVRGGGPKEQIALDPGLDFDLSVDDDLEILRRLGEFRDLGRPLFVALSRKDFLGAVLAGSWERRAAAAEREWATAAATALAVAGGAEILRLHDRSSL